VTTPVLLSILFDLRVQLKLGRSVPHSLEEILKHRSDAFSKSLKMWLMKLQAGSNSNQIIELLPELKKTHARKAFLSILERGIRGSPMDSVLESFEEELFMKMENIFETRIQVLPLKLLVPLMLLVLPGVMGILLGPLLALFSRGNL